MSRRRRRRRREDLLLLAFFHRNTNATSVVRTSSSFIRSSSSLQFFSPFPQGTALGKMKFLHPPPPLDCRHFSPSVFFPEQMNRLFLLVGLSFPPINNNKQ